jgi:exonuclease III
MDSNNILVWNVRGINRWAQRDNVCKVVDASWSAVVCLQETKLANISQWDVWAMLGRVFESLVYLPAQGTRGGILVAWRKGSFVALQSHIHKNSLIIKFKVGDEEAWWFTRFYGP